MKKHNHSSDDRLIQYRGKHSRQSRGQALTNFPSDRHMPVALVFDSIEAELERCGIEL
jgi:hypothetical protein